MKRMIIGEKKLPFSIIKKSKYIIHKGKGKIGPQTSVRRWLKIGNKSNRHKKVTKRSWKLLKELWDEIRINNKKMQTTDVDMATVSGEESFDGEMEQSFSKMEISTPSPPPFNANIKPSDSVKFDRCHTPSMSSGNIELEQFPEPQEDISARERNTHFSPSAESLPSEREKVSSTSQCPYRPAKNLDPQLAAFIMDLKNYNEYRNRMEAMTLEKAELERLSAEANLHHNELQVDVQ
ncbi:uncharacterized protein LOC124155095 [Ischnura elegans]|uniref:uncharacterized protein LOC124155095 n=1 Tax=Ischnura elegans TaxID=197161 RepID=UPI001ED871F0|nr:uncharacterized protein LOC124155095 [Ischnura elegans]